MSENAQQRMIVKEIRIWKKESYESENPGRFVARVNIESPRGNMEIPLDAGIAEKLVEYLGPIVAEFSKRAVAELLGDIQTQMQSLKAPAIEQIAEKVDGV